MKATTFTLLLLCTFPVLAQVELDAKPAVKVESSAGATSRLLLSEPDRTKYRVTILIRDGRYFGHRVKTENWYIVSLGRSSSLSNRTVAVTSRYSTHIRCRNPCATPDRGFNIWSIRPFDWAQSLIGVQAKNLGLIKIRQREEI